MKNLSKVLGVAGVLVMCATAHAQDPAAVPPAPAAAPGASVTVDTQTTTGAADDTIVGSTAPDVMPTTGGAPFALALLGGLTATGAFLARRKLSNA